MSIEWTLEKHLMTFFEMRRAQGYPDRMNELFAWLCEPGRISSVVVEKKLLRVLQQFTDTTIPSAVDLIGAEEKRGRRGRKRSYPESAHPFDPSRVNEYSQEELKAYCVQNNLVIYGTKEILRQRLLVYYNDQSLNPACE